KAPTAVIVGDTVFLNSLFAINGDLGTLTTPIQTQAVTSITINETGDGVVVNDSLANPGVSLAVTASRSINFANTSSTGGTPTLTLGLAGPPAQGVLATSNGGGAIVISNSGQINVGVLGKNIPITGNSISIFNTGTVAAGINVIDGTLVTANLGSITM